jgi:hypothetical protein
MLTEPNAAASDNDGGLIWRDMRQPMADAKRWNIDYYKGEESLQVGSRGEVRVSLIDVDRADYVRIGQCPV